MASGQNGTGDKGALMSQMAGWAQPWSGTAPWRHPMLGAMTPPGSLDPMQMPGMQAQQQGTATQAPVAATQPAAAAATPSYGAGVAPGQTPDVPMPGIPDYIWQLALNPPGN